MQYYPQSRKGFVIDYDLAEQLNFLDEFVLWEEEYNELPLMEVIEEKLGVEPIGVQHFEYVRGGYVQGLQGFDYDTSYILFDQDSEQIYPEEWETLINTLEENDVNVVHGSWAELG